MVYVRVIGSWTYVNRDPPEDYGSLDLGKWDNRDRIVSWGGRNADREGITCVSLAGTLAMELEKISAYKTGTILLDSGNIFVSCLR
ncbi:MAG: hypothetical protein GF368_03565 [Candidatus Aenigmarchaeota archaeon]|nr:hypothetical protein [Candidatus Aenigmarchaeota archaeon]